MRKKDFKLRDWIPIKKFMIAIPLGYCSLTLDESTSSVDSEIFKMVMWAICVGLITYMLLSLKKLLTVKFNFYETNNLINILIGTNIILLLISIFFSFSKEILILIVLIPLGVVQIILFSKLPKLKDY